MSGKRVTPQEARELCDQEGYVYLDVRSIPEFEQGHPKGAYNIPLLHFSGGRMAPNQEFLEVVKKAFPTDARLAVGCKSGGRSAQAVSVLEQHGYANLVDVRGGFGGEFDRMGQCVVPGWGAAGLPVAATPEPGRTYQELKSKP